MRTCAKMVYQQAQLGEYGMITTYTESLKSKFVSVGTSWM